jgi:hypothetical protein
MPELKEKKKLILIDMKDEKHPSTIIELPTGWQCRGHGLLLGPDAALAGIFVRLTASFLAPLAASV